MSITGKDIFGYLLLGVIGVFGAILMYRNVNPDTSHGLQELIAILAVVAGAYMNERVRKNNE
jgi:hypothetical protein